MVQITPSIIWFSRHVMIPISLFSSATSATVKPLTEGETYQFRVRGENAAGLGEPSKPTDKVKVEDQPEKPEYVFYFVTVTHCMADWVFLRISMSDCRFDPADIPSEITVRAGQELKITVPYKGGHPPPKALWSNNDVPVDEKRAVVEVCLSVL